MKLKLTFKVMLRRLLIILSVVISFTVLFACSDDSSPTALPTISDVFATDVAVVYDGRPHSITVVNNLPTDAVVYSVDNINFFTAVPSFTMPGVYTVYFKVDRDGYVELSSSATVTISPSVLSGVSASDVSFVCDGQAHSIDIDGALATDSITYSTDGVTFTDTPPTFTDAGEYIVYYCVDRGYGQYKSSCVVTILPNIYGKYFNPTFGLVVLSQSSAKVNSETFPLAFSADGSGSIGTSPFKAANNTLSYNNLSFAKISQSEYVYKLSAGEQSVYFSAAADGALNISFDDDRAQISMDSTTLLTVQNVNYCESAEITDYINLKFTQRFSHSSDITEVGVTLLLRERNPLSADCSYVTYDGQPHRFDIADGAVLIDSDGAQIDIPSFTDVGKYSVKALIVSDTYLPVIIDYTMVILPNIDGTYFASTGVIQIADGKVYVDGVHYGNTEIVDDEWAYNGLAIKTTDDGIEYDGVAYVATSETVFIITVDGKTRMCVALPDDTDQMYAIFDGERLTFICNDESLTDITLACSSVSIILNGNNMTPIESEEGTLTFVLGVSDVISPIITVNVVTKQ